MPDDGGHQRREHRNAAPCPRGNRVGREDDEGAALLREGHGQRRRPRLADGRAGDNGRARADATRAPREPEETRAAKRRVARHRGREAYPRLDGEIDPATLTRSQGHGQETPQGTPDALGDVQGRRLHTLVVSHEPAAHGRRRPSKA